MNGGSCVAAGALLLLTPAFRLGFVMTTEMGFSPDDNGRKARHSLKL